MSRVLARNFFAVAALVGLWAGSAHEAQGLTIYRIGGADLSPPELAQEEDVEFIQLNWIDVDENRHGSINLLDVAPASIRPVQVDPEENLTPLLEERGGQIFTLDWLGWKKHIEEDVPIYDGDLTSVYLGDGHFASHGPAHKDYIFDFGGRFLIERIRIYPRERFMAERFIESFIIGTSDGDPLKDGSRDYVVGSRGDYRDFDVVHDVTENTRAHLELELPLQPIQFLLFQAPENKKGIWEIAEFEIYGTGYAPLSSYVTNVIDLGAPASLGELHWSGEADPGAQVELTMRSGADDNPNIYWRYTFRGDEISRFDDKGRPLTLQSYGKLGKGQQAGITHDTESWDFWGPAYDFAAGKGLLQGDRPQQFLQLKVDIASTRAASGRLDYLEFAVSLPPVASRVLAEIAPTMVRAGEVTAFTYRLLPSLKADDLGFDTIEIETPVRAEGVDAVRIGGVAVAFDELRREGDGFAVRIPRIDLQRADELIEVDFRVAVFKFGTVFGGRIVDSERAHEVHQVVTPGDADPLVDGNGLSVALTEVGQKAIHALRFTSSVLTPNGDGVNDALGIEYDLLNLFGQVPVAIDVYDLSGRLLAKVYRGTADSGRFSVGWDGRDGSGALLSPGLYLLRLEVETDEGTDRMDQIISLVY